MLPSQLKTLNSQIALLIEHTNTCTVTLRKADELLELYKANETDLKKTIANNNTVIANDNQTIANLKQAQKNTRKKWIRNALYAGCGGLTAGMVIGLLAK